MSEVSRTMKAWLRENEFGPEVADVTGSVDERAVRKLSRIRWSYNACMRLLKGEKFRRVCERVTLRRHKHCCTLNFYRKPLVRFYEDGSVQVTTCEPKFETAYSLKFLDACTPRWFSFYKTQHDRWFVDTPDGRLPYRDGMTLRAETLAV